MTGPGTVKRLEAHGIYTMGDLARFSIYGEDRLYEIFGVDVYKRQVCQLTIKDIAELKCAAESKPYEDENEIR